MSTIKKKTTQKILNPEEKLKKEKEHELMMIERELPFLNEPTYHFKIGDKVVLGNLKDCTIDEILYDGKVYGITCLHRSEFYGDVKEEPHYRVAAWHEIRPITFKNTQFATNQDIRVHFNDSDIQSLLHDYYSFGINMDPEYQREIVWTIEDKEKLLDSIFLNADIGKFVLYEPEYGLYEEKMYEILDGKQRLTTLIEYYENRFPYRGVYYNDLSPSDKSYFKHHRIQTAKLRNLDKEAVLEQFIRLNTTGKPMDISHLEKVAKQLQELRESASIPQITM